VNESSRESLIDKLIEIDCHKFAEIGVLDGATTHYLLNHLINLKEYWAVDLWRPYKSRRRRNYDYYANTPIEHWDDMYLGVCKNMIYFKSLQVLRLPSLKAASIFMVDYFDVVLIDADHAYESVLEDINAWLPLIKKGGYLCGDDWCPGHPGVRKAVSERFGDNIEVDKNRMWWYRV